MNEESMVQAAQLMIDENVPMVIISTAYDTWKKEASLRACMLTDRGIGLGQIVVVGEVTNSYDEIEKTREIIRERGFEKVIIVAEKWHSSRVLKTFQFFFPELEIEMRVFISPRFEFTYEPSLIKSLRIGWETTWMLWNKFFELLTPLMLKYTKK